MYYFLFGWLEKLVWGCIYHSCLCCGVGVDEQFVCCCCCCFLKLPKSISNRNNNNKNNYNYNNNNNNNHSKNHKKIKSNHELMSYVQLTDNDRDCDDRNL